MKPVPKILMIALVLFALLTPAAQSADNSKYSFHIRNGNLRRGTYSFSIQAIATPGLMKPGTPQTEVAAMLNRAAAVGANTVCFDLAGFSADGAALSKDTVETVKTVLHQVTWRRMGAICRVLGEDCPEDEAFRKAAVLAAAKAFQNERRMIYWIDGPGCANLVKELSKAAPRLVVAAPEGGAIRVAETVPQRKADKPVIVVGTVPPAKQRAAVGCLMPATDEAYAGLDAAMAHPSESQPWTPDNSVLSEEERAAGWIALFDGKSLDGWWIAGANKKGFEVRDGAIEWVRGGGSMVMTHDRYDNFILRFDWKIAENGNSGMFLRAPRANRASKIGMEFQLRDTQGTAPDAHTAGAVYDVVAPTADGAKAAGEWNETEITLDGPRLKAVMNGRVVQDIDLDENEELRPRLRRGFIALQDHGNYVAFRNIRLKKL